MSRIEIPGIHLHPNLDEGYRIQLGSITFDSVSESLKCGSCTLNFFNKRNAMYTR